MGFGRHRLLQDFQVELLTGSSVYTCHIHDRLVKDWLQSHCVNVDGKEDSSLLPFSFFIELLMGIASKKGLVNVSLD